MSAQKENVSKKKATDAVSVNLNNEMLDDEATTDEAKKEITREQFIDESYALFKKYYQGTREFREKCRLNEEYWKTNHWFQKRTKPGDPKPTTPLIFSMVDNMHSDVMDHYPEPQILPVEPGDDELAEELTAIINSILERRKFKKIYRASTKKALKRGAVCWETRWDKSLYNGRGDINVIDRDIRYCLWEPGVEDIQDGENFFTYDFYTKAYYKAHYPEQYTKMRGDGWRNQIERYNTEDTDNDDNKEILMFNRWYKKWDKEAQCDRVHCVSIAGYQILYWSEEVMEENTQKEGVYQDGLYPFIVMPLYPLDDTPIGLSVIDIFRDNQDYIDKLDQIVLKNALMAGKLRLLKTTKCTIPLEKLADWGEETLEGENIGDDDIRWFQGRPLPSLVQQHLVMKIDMMKEESGQNQFNRGEGGKGVTAASAIMALQEAGSKRSRNMISHFYDYFSEIVWMMASRVRQFYDSERVARINPHRSPNLYKRINKESETVKAGESKSVIFMKFDKSKFNDRADLEFDIKIRAQRQSPYQSAYLNELAVELHKAGIMTDEEMLEMMDFEGKNRVQAMVEDRKNDEKEKLIQSQRELINTMEQEIAVLQNQVQGERSQQT